MSDLNIDELKKTVLDKYRAGGKAGLGFGISWPIPIVGSGVVHVMVFVYPSVASSQKGQIVTRIGRPVVELEVSVKTANIIKEYPLDQKKDSKGVIFPDKKAESIPVDEWSKLIDELEKLYPLVIENYRQWGPMESKIFDRFVELFDLVTPEYLRADYEHLNPDFFRWLHFKLTKTGGSLTERIVRAIQTLTVEDLDNLRREDLKYLSQEQLSAYIFHASKNGRTYYLRMSVQTEPGVYEVRSGNFFGWVRKDKQTGKWELADGGGLIPIGLIATAPLMVTKEKFIEDLETEGVPKTVIDQLVGGGMGITS